MGGRRKGKDPNHGNSTMVKMRRFMVQVNPWGYTCTLKYIRSNLMKRPSNE